MKTQISEAIVRLISERLGERNDKGFETYKETLDDVPWENYDWNMMAMEELLDMCQYLMKHNMQLQYEIKRLSSEMKFNEFQIMSKKTMPSYYSTETERLSKSNYALGLCGESGELGEIVKKNVHHGHEFDRDKFVKEAGDVLHYLAGICTMYDVTLEEVATMNLFKLGKRYKNGFTSEESKQRVDTLTGSKTQYVVENGEIKPMRIWTNEGDL